MARKQKESVDTDTMVVVLVDHYDRVISSGRLPINVLAEYSSLIHCDRHFTYARMSEGKVFFVETKPAYLVSEF